MRRLVEDHDRIAGGLNDVVRRLFPRDWISKPRSGLISDQCMADKISPALGEIDLLILAGQTGLRATELTQLTIGDAHLGTGPHVSCLGKGRKQRTIPLTRTTPTSPSKNEPSRAPHH